MENQPNLSRHSINVDPDSQVNNNYPTTTSATETPPLASSAAHVMGHTVHALYLATMKGDWEKAKGIIDGDRNLLTERIAYPGMTSLMLAARECHSEFIEKLLELMSAEEVGMQEEYYGNTALHLYASCGNSIKTAQAFLRKNASLTQIKNFQVFVPLHFTCFAYGNKDMVWYLTLVTTDEDPFTGSQAGSLVSGLASAGFYDVTLYLLKRYPNLAMARSSNNLDIIASLAQRVADFPSGSKLGFWERFLYKCITTTDLIQLPPEHIVQYAISLHNTNNLTNFPSSTQLKTYEHPANRRFRLLLRGAIEIIVPRLKNVRETKTRQKYAIALVNVVCERLSTLEFQEVVNYFNNSTPWYTATYYGVAEIIAIYLKQFPELIQFHVANGQGILNFSIYYRHEKIFNIIKSMSACRQLANYYDPQTNNTLLHQVAYMAPTVRLLSVSGTALQMQRELQWFKEVENLLLPDRKMLKNVHNKTAQEVFTQQHKELAENGEKWMKDTSTSCMVVAALIATVLFAGAFTVPGGNTGDKGIPIYLHENIFMVFVVSDTIGLLSSLTSVLMFLAILTARYAEEDFLKSLPQKLVLGFASLFCAIAAMMITFGSALSIVLKDKLRGGMIIPITLLATFPVTMFAMLQVPLFIEMIQSTYGAGIFKPHNVF